MGETVEKKDWENARQQHEAFYVNSIVAADIHKTVLELCKIKLKEFPEADPMPEEVKEIIK